MFPIHNESEVTTSSKTDQDMTVRILYKNIYKDPSG